MTERYAAFSDCCVSPPALDLVSDQWEASASLFNAVFTLLMRFVFNVRFSQKHGTCVLVKITALTLQQA